MIRTSRRTLLAMLISAMGGGCTVWPPDLPGRSSVSSPAAEGSSSAATENSATDSKSRPREEPYYIE
jgi:hypothetical protein